VSSYVPDHLAVNSEELLAAADSLEKVVYFYPFPGFSESWSPVFYQTLITMIILRRIGDTPYLKVVSFSVHDKVLWREGSSDFQQWERTEGITAPSSEVHQRYFDEVLKLRFTDSIAISNYLSGVAVPDGTGFRYIGALRTMTSDTCLAQIMACTRGPQDSMTRHWHLYCDYKLDTQNIYLDASLIVNSYVSGKTSPATHSILLLGRAHDGIQNFVAEMG
jgi:hypothetical protein